MNCPDVRNRLLDMQRDRLELQVRQELADHLEACAACARANEAERVLSSLLEARLPRYAAPPELKRRLAHLAVTAAAPALALVFGALMQSMARVRWMRTVAPALAVVLALGTTVLVVGRSGKRENAALASMTGEAVNDHLRILNSAHPLDIESSANHQVKPWFEGKLDFAPVVPEPAAPDLRLEGGAVGYFFDRKAAVVVYGLRRHAVTMLVFRAQGLPWPPPGTSRLAAAEAFQASDRGFHTVFWRSGELGYALISDIDPKELEALAVRFVSST
jgi:anti-sigma factor RsiW